MSDVLIVAEIGQAHDGSLGILHSYIDAIAGIGVHAAKFQTHFAEAESSIYEPFRVPFSYEDKTRFDYWKRMEFTQEQWKGIKDHCTQVGLKFISSPFSNMAVDVLENVGVDYYKIGSGEVTNHLLLEKIARTRKKVILSSGMSSWDELDLAVSILAGRAPDVYILQCTTKYPTAPEDIGLNLIAEISKRYRLPAGLSDHSGTIFPSLAAVALGAKMVEVHTVFHKRMFGPDTKSSVSLEELRVLVDGVKYISESLDRLLQMDNSAFVDLKAIFEKSLAVNCDMKAGEILSFECLESKKPLGKGLPASEYNKVIGKRLKRDLCKWDFITEELIQ